MSEEKKLTDEEIVKALECCVEVGRCGECPYHINKIDCVPYQRIEKDSLDLIHRLQSENAKQKAEIERLTKEKSFATRKMMESKAKAVELQKQVDELTEAGNEAVRSFTRMETLYKVKCKELEISEEKARQAVKDTAKKFADLVEFHSIARMNDGVEYFTISALGLKEILVEEFGFKYSELNGVEVER
jgi:predicted RNase H-like nuclease (RuvC/YqgF family)